MKVILISSDCFGYDKLIVKKAIELGLEAYYIDSSIIKKKRGVLVNIKKIYFKLFKQTSLHRYEINQYVVKKIKEIEKVNKILIIHPQLLTNKTLMICREFTEDLISYHYDGIKVFPKIIRTLPYFDSNYSYDKKDVEKFNLKFLTNFIYKKQEDYTKATLSAFNISSLDFRTVLLEKISEELKRHGYNHEFYIIASNKKIKKYKKTHKIDRHHFQFGTELISLHETWLKIERSSLMIDIQNTNQIGLSFRVFEALGAKKKLITTNTDIVTYDFYHPNNILIIDINNPVIPKAFLSSEYLEINNNILDKYMLASWVETIFDL